MFCLFAKSRWCNIAYKWSPLLCKYKFRALEGTAKQLIILLERKCLIQLAMQLKSAQLVLLKSRWIHGLKSGFGNQITRSTNYVLGSDPQDFPLIFHGVTGIDEREESSPSFFNVAEVEVLMDYVRKLLQSNGKKGHGTIAPREIGIIAPYRKQVCITLTHPKYMAQGTSSNCANVLTKVAFFLWLFHRCRKSAGLLIKLPRTLNSRTWMASRWLFYTEIVRLWRFWQMWQCCCLTYVCVCACSRLALWRSSKVRSGKSSWCLQSEAARITPSSTKDSALALSRMKK